MTIKSKIKRGEPEYGTDSPTVECDNCGTKGLSHQMINLTVSIGSPGHPSLTGFACIDHWACSMECWEAIAHECVHRHTLQELKMRRQKVGLEP